MKAHLYDLKGQKKGEVELPHVFDTHVREDLVQKYFEVDKEMQPYGLYTEAGKRHSASGTISHKRHDWKGQYGRGISRTPRKAMSRRGTQFNWVGAEVSNTRGGRRPHGPKPSFARKKINRKEAVQAMHSAFAATAHEKYLIQRYATLKELKVRVPIVVENLEHVKTKEFIALLKNVLGPVFELAMQHKEVRAGKGKLRGRKYKSNAGLLLVTSAHEKVKLSGVDVRTTHDVAIEDLYPLGRLVMYTEKALGELK